MRKLLAKGENEDMGQINTNNCSLTTCRYNADGKCTNEEKREECVEVSRKVLCEDVNSSIAR